MAHCSVQQFLEIWIKTTCEHLNKRASMCEVAHEYIVGRASGIYIIYVLVFLN